MSKNIIVLTQKKTCMWNSIRYISQIRDSIAILPPCWIAAHNNSCLWLGIESVHWVYTKRCTGALALRKCRRCKLFWIIKRALKVIRGFADLRAKATKSDVSRKNIFPCTLPEWRRFWRWNLTQGSSVRPETYPSACLYSRDPRYAKPAVWPGWYIRS